MVAAGAGGDGGNPNTSHAETLPRSRFSGPEEFQHE
jgi:hypothetical protein